MINITMSEFLSAPENYLNNAAVNDDFLTVQTEGGKAVVISEAEWKILLDAFEMMIHKK